MLLPSGLPITLMVPSALISDPRAISRLTVRIHLTLEREDS